MIRHLSYVACDCCGDPEEPSPDGAAGARRMARASGWVVKNGDDLCPFCAVEGHDCKQRDTIGDDVETLPPGDYGFVRVIDAVDRPLQHNPDPITVVTGDVYCSGCRKRAPWCSCGKADYR